MKIQKLLVALFLVYCTSVAMAASPENETRDAEHVAQVYMTAFFHGDAMIAASQLHPESLEKIRLAIVGEVEKAKTAGTTKELLNQLGFELDADALLKMNSYEIYAEIIKSNHLKAGQAASQAMKAATVEAVKTDPINPDKATVYLRVKIPKNGQFITQNSTISLLRHSGSWRVVPDGQ